jgi:hypothetical protein
MPLFRSRCFVALVINLYGAKTRGTDLTFPRGAEEEHESAACKLRRCQWINPLADWLEGRAMVTGVRGDFLLLGELQKVFIADANRPKDVVPKDFIPLAKAFFNTRPGATVALSETCTIRINGVPAWVIQSPPGMAETQSSSLPGSNVPRYMSVLHGMHT